MLIKANKLYPIKMKMIFLIFNLNNIPQKTIEIYSINPHYKGKSYNTNLIFSPISMKPVNNTNKNPYESNLPFLNFTHKEALFAIKDDF